MATPGWVTPAPTMSAALRGCDCSEIYMDSLITCKEISGTGTADGYHRHHCTQHTTQEECAGSDGQYRGANTGSGPNTCKWYGTEESGDGGSYFGGGGDGGDGDAAHSMRNACLGQVGQKTALAPSAGEGARAATHRTTGGSMTRHSLTLLCTLLSAHQVIGFAVLNGPARVHSPRSVAAGRPKLAPRAICRALPENKRSGPPRDSIIEQGWRQF